ncbi:hypothetical protein MEQU1_000155 [Malassezia equina]|uniref:FHA domain-containing protein n=1 Tax=Malassezia equina TaxID=1381935 RepID=A0AAF0IYK9_9BASI|nr:hypothetical protein MEQU1_000155 [Malassezia equina]
MSNDVRLLLGDVSREHARLRIDDQGYAFMEVLGVNGLWHNDKLILPDSPPTPWPLSEGDVLRISQHTFSFSYAPKPKQQSSCAPLDTSTQASLCVAPEERTELSSSSPPTTMSPSTANHKAAKQKETGTPTRRSARIQARASMPSLRHGRTPEKNLRPVPLTQQTTTSVQHRLDLASPCVARRPQETVSVVDLSKNRSPTPSKEGYSALQDTACSMEAQETDACTVSPSPTKQDDMSQDMDMSNVAAASKEAPQDDAWDDVDENDEPASMESVGLKRMETVLWESELISEPPSASTPSSSWPRYPMAKLRKSGGASPLVWSPSKSRKVSLRTATLLKRSAQLPILPIPETTRRAPTLSLLAEKEAEPAPYSSGSQDMDISSTVLAQDADTSSNDEESEVEQSYELQVQTDKLSEEAQVMSPDAVSTPRDMPPAPKAVPRTFFTPQLEKAHNPAHRRLSLENTRPSAKVATPGLKHKSSWQWLKGMLSPGKRDTVQAPAANTSKESDTKLDEATSMEGVTSHNDQDTKHAQVTDESDNDEFYDTDDEMAGRNEEETDVITMRESSIPAMASPFVHPPALSSSHGPQTPSNCWDTDVSPTPDMHMLKHLFAEPKPAMSTESAMADFRHLVYKNERNAERTSDISLRSPWAALEKEAREDSRKTTQPVTDMSPVQNKQRLTGVKKPSPYMPMSTNRPVTITNCNHRDTLIHDLIIIDGLCRMKTSKIITDQGL